MSEKITVKQAAEQLGSQSNLSGWAFNVVFYHLVMPLLEVEKGGIITSMKLI